MNPSLPIHAVPGFAPRTRMTRQGLRAAASPQWWPACRATRRWLRCVALLPAFPALALLACEARAANYPLDKPIVWQAPLGREHPLTGRIWEVESGRFVDERSLLERLVDVRFVVAGESHNNPDHHQLQLRILKAMFGNGRRLSVGFEIFETDDQPALDRFIARHETSLEDLIDSLGWGRRHRALWEQYRPLVRFAGEAGLPLIAMNLSRRETAAVMQHGTAALPQQLVSRFALHQPLPPQQQALLTGDLIRAHCGLLFSQNLDGLVLTQRTRDATMAARLEASDTGAGTLLLSGYGHARGDRGVPYLLDGLRQRGELVSVLFASVKEALGSPRDYRQWFGSDRLPFDYVWFTPRVDDEDPCDRLRRIYGRDHMPPAATPPATSRPCSMVPFRVASIAGRRACGLSDSRHSTPPARSCHGRAAKPISADAGNPPKKTPSSRLAYAPPASSG